MKERIALSKLFTFQLAKLGIKTCIGHSMLFYFCKLYDDQIPFFTCCPSMLCKILVVAAFAILLSDMLIFQAGVIHLASACSVVLYSLALYLP